MVAGQQKKRSNSSNLLRISSHDDIKSKKPKKHDATDKLLNTTKELVGIRWRDMPSFLDQVPRIKSCMADVISVPQELFDPVSVSNMFSYEAWKTFLSEHERHLLAQFLPSGFDMDHVVKSLFSGENLHFGNPFCNWVASLCSGNLHPDEVQLKEHQLRARRNAYFVGLKDYHFGFIERIKKLKESLDSFGDPAEDFEDKILRIREGNPTALEEELKEMDLDNGDSKYMAYIKITKKQHRMVMNVKNPDDGIPPKSLSNILGDISLLNFKSYAILEEEEREKMHSHWLKLVNEDLPGEFKNLGLHKTLRNNLKKSIHCELVAKEIERSEGMAEKEKERLMWMTHPEEAENKTPEVTFTQEQPRDKRHIHSSYHHFADCRGLDLERIMEQKASPSDVSVDASLDCHMGPPAWQLLKSVEQTRSSPPQEVNNDRRETMFGDDAMLRLVSPEHLNKLEPSELRLSLASTTQYEELIGLDHQLFFNRNTDLRAREIPVNSQEPNNSIISGLSDPTWPPMGSAGSADGSLFCVLSECNNLLSGFRQTSSRSEQFPRGGIYLSPGLDASASRDGAVVWRNFPNQRPGLS